jgi:outer membrane lipoprotein SlyB
MKVETNQSLRKGPSNTNQEVMKMGGGAALGAIIGAIAGGGKGAAIGAGAGGAAGTGAVLLGHGKPAVIDNETRLTFELANPTTLTEKLN